MDGSVILRSLSKAAYVNNNALFSVLSRLCGCVEGRCVCVCVLKEDGCQREQTKKWPPLGVVFYQVTLSAVSR